MYFRHVYTLLGFLGQPQNQPRDPSWPVRCGIVSGTWGWHADMHGAGHKTFRGISNNSHLPRIKIVPTAGDTELETEPTSVAHPGKQRPRREKRRKNTTQKDPSKGFRLTVLHALGAALGAPQGA